MSRRKSALITGGSQGIGLACAQLLYEKGYDICLMSRSPNKLDEAARSVSAGA
ncbi:SDR family NAD(P)-dependent oxidoreductase, partial [Enterocloster asparagiformis]